MHYCTCNTPPRNIYINFAYITITISLLTYAIPIILLEEIPRPQSAVPEPSLHQPAEVPTRAPTSVTATHRCPITSPGEASTDIFLPLNPVLEIPPPGPAVTPVNTLPAFHLDASISHGNTLITAEDEDDIWREMVETFEDLYQGLAAEDVPTPAETNSMITHTPPDDAITNPERTSVVDNQARNLFARPFHLGFHRVVHIDQQDNYSISYIAPDKIARLQLSEAMEQFLRENPTLDVSISDFCWAHLILGFKEPTWETIHVEEQRQLHSRTPSGPPSASSLESAPDNQTPPSADVDDVQHEQLSNNTDNPWWALNQTQFPHSPRPHRLDNTLKPNGPHHPRHVHNRGR